MERHIVAASLTSPLERLAGQAPYSPTILDVPLDFTGEIDTGGCLFLYVNITDYPPLSPEVWAAILRQVHTHTHAILYCLDFRIDPGQGSYKGYQELALYPLRMIEKGTPTYVGFRVPSEEEEREEGWMVVSTYSLYPMVKNGA